MAVREAFSKVGQEWKSLFSGLFNVGSTTGGIVGSVSRGVGSAASTAASTTATGAVRLLGPKPWLIGGLVLAGTGALAGLALTGSTGRKFRESDAQNEQLAALQFPGQQELMAMPQPQQVSMSSPADFPDSPHARNVLAGRGQTMPQPNVSQPQADAAIRATQLGA